MSISININNKSNAAYVPYMYQYRTEHREYTKTYCSDKR